MYHFDEIVNRKNTHCVKWDTVPEDTLPMFVADMDFKVLPEIQEALEKKVKEGIYGYTIVSDDYLQSVVDWEERRHHVHIEKEWIVTTPGIVPALNAMVNTFTHEGDAIMIQDPVYFPFKGAVVNNQRRLVLHEVKMNEQGHYTFDFEALEKKIIEEQVKLFILCNPHNPIGRVWTREELKTLGNICKKHHVIVIADEIHADFIMKGHEHICFYDVDESFKDFSVVCTAPSKTFNLAGLAASNILIAHPEMRASFTAFKGRTGMGSVNAFGLISCEAAYRHGDQYVDELCAYIEENANCVRNFLQEHLPEVKMVPLEGTYLAWLDFGYLNMEDEALEAFFLNDAKVKMNSGITFGSQGHGFMRMNLATPRKNVEEGLRRIEKSIKER